TDPGMDPALTAEIAALVGRREDAVMPDIGVDIEALAAVEPEGLEIGRLNVVAGQGERHDERRLVEREEHLPAIGMIVGAPHQRAIAPGGRIPLRSLARQAAPAEHIIAAHRVVLGAQDIADPLTRKDALGGAALVAAIRIDRPPALSWP